MRNHIANDYSNLKEKIALEIKEAFKFSGVAVCLDLWQDKLRKIHYLGATCHYLQRDNETQKLKLHSRVLQLVALDAELPKEATRLYDAVVEILMNYDIYDNIDEITFVTDRGANIVNSVDGHKHYSCINHYFNNVVKASFGPISQLKADVNRIVKYMKCSGKNVSLSSTLNSFVKTRWNSFYLTLKSLIVVFEEIEPLINPKRKDIKRLFRTLNLRELTEICTFLEQFHLLTVELEYDTQVTAVKVLPSHEVLLKHIETQRTDHSTVHKMKLAAQKYVDDNDVLPKDAAVWAFFDPRFKRMQNFHYTQFTQADVVRKLEMQLAIDDTMNYAHSNTQMEMSQHGRNKSVFDEIIDTNATGHSSVLSVSEEISLYIKAPYKNNLSVIEFWEQNSQQFPRLFKYFLSFAAIPGASSAVERMFSISSCILTNKRARLDSNVLNMLTFLNKNID